MTIKTSKRTEFKVECANNVFAIASNLLKLPPSARITDIETFTLDMYDRWPILDSITIHLEDQSD